MARPVAMADICSVASVCAFLKKSNTMCSWVVDDVVLALLLMYMLFDAGGWKQYVDVRAISDIIASSDLAAMLF